MINLTSALIEAFAPHRNACGDVVINHVTAPINALKILLDMGLNVSPKIVVMEFEERGSWKPSTFISSYQYLELGTENDKNQNNVATYNPAMGLLVIHTYRGKNTVGRGHDKNLCKKWLDASFCCVPT